MWNTFGRLTNLGRDGILLALDQAVDVRAEIHELRQLLRRKLVARPRQIDADDLLDLRR